MVFHKCFAKALDARILEPYKNSWTSLLCAAEEASAISDGDSMTSPCSKRPVLSNAASLYLASALFLSYDNVMVHIIPLFLQTYYFPVFSANILPSLIKVISLLPNQPKAQTSWTTFSKNGYFCWGTWGGWSRARKNCRTGCSRCSSGPRR